MDLLTFEESCTARECVTPQSNFHGEAALHAIAQTTVKQLKMKSDGQEEENAKLKVCGGANRSKRH